MSCHPLGKLILPTWLSCVFESIPKYQPSGNVDTAAINRKQRHARWSHKISKAINLVHPLTSTGGAHPVPFHIHDSGPLAVAQRIIVYAGDDALTHPASSDTWFMDGNFKSAPGLFE